MCRQILIGRVQGIRQLARRLAEAPNGECTETANIMYEDPASVLQGNSKISCFIFADQVARGRNGLFECRALGIATSDTVLRSKGLIGRTPQLSRPAARLGMFHSAVTEYQTRPCSPRRRGARYPETAIQMPAFTLQHAKVQIGPQAWSGALWHLLLVRYSYLAADSGFVMGYLVCTTPV